MTSLEEKLLKLKKLDEIKEGTDWNVYKKKWISSINHLHHTIVYSYFQDYEEQGLMKFSFIPVSRFETYFGEYITSLLEIDLVNSRSLILEPIAAVTSDYHGRLDFYLRGNANKKVTIFRKLLSNNSFSQRAKFEWIIAKSYDPKDQFKLDKAQIEKLIEEWLS